MARLRRPDANHDVLRQMAEREEVFAPEEFDQWLCQQGWAWQALDRGDYGITLEQAMFLFVFEDPVRWAETFLVEPRTGEPWQFFDYQRESVRAWRQDVVHQDGAEVGKTREITVLILWGQCTSMGFTVRRPWMLVGAPQQTHLDAKSSSPSRRRWARRKAATRPAARCSASSGCGRSARRT